MKGGQEDIMDDWTSSKNYVYDLVREVQVYIRIQFPKDAYMEYKLNQINTFITDSAIIIDYKED